MMNTSSNTRAASLMASFAKISEKASYDSDTAITQLVARHGPTANFIKQAQKKDPQAADQVLRSYAAHLHKALRNSGLMNRIASTLHKYDEEQEKTATNRRGSTHSTAFQLSGNAGKVQVEGGFSHGEDGGLFIVNIYDTTRHTGPVHTAPRLLSFSPSAKYVYSMDTSPEGWAKLQMIRTGIDGEEAKKLAAEKARCQTSLNNSAANLGIRL